MDKFWMKAVTVTGPVAVVGILMLMFINNLFREEVLGYFGSERSFFLVAGALLLLGILFAIAILRYKRSQSAEEISAKGLGDSKTATITNSQVTGDIVFGDKTVNQSGEHDQ